MLSDLRVGLRYLFKDKVFTVTAATTLALCIGANTALFSVVYNVLLRPLPVPESDQIVLMGNAYPKAGADIGSSSGVPDWPNKSFTPMNSIGTGKFCAKTSATAEPIPPAI